MPHADAPSPTASLEHHIAEVGMAIDEQQAEAGPSDHEARKDRRHKTYCANHFVSEPQRPYPTGGAQQCDDVKDQSGTILANKARPRRDPSLRLSRSHPDWRWVDAAAICKAEGAKARHGKQPV